jgi:rhodanese-related sulfurtransferase
MPLPFAVEGWQILCEEILPEQILDLRPADAYDRAHLEGAVSVPYSEFQDEAEAALDKGRTVLLVDAGGARAAEMVIWLRERGYDAAYLKGGMAGWTGPLDR